MTKDKQRIISFVMSGGVGSRLWPLSREDFPKQFHNLSGQGSMLLRTVKRMGARTKAAVPVYLLASERHADHINQDIAGVDLAGGRPILEPMGRNTASAVVLATEITLREHGDELVLVVPSDHEITTDRDFWNTVETGIGAANAGRIVVFRNTARSPRNRVWLYRSRAGDLSDARRGAFRGKTERDRQPSNISNSGHFLWNAGIFLFRASVMRDAFKAHAAEIWDKAIIALDQADTNISGTYVPHDLYAAVPSISVDYAIMEHASDIALVPATFRWNDLGSWQSLLEVGSVDGNGNVIVGDVVAIDCEHSYLRSEGRLLSAVGLRDTAVVATADATFVAPVSESQNVRKIVEQLEKTGRLETKFTPAQDRLPHVGAYGNRVRHWLFDETLPLWSTVGVDEQNGGFHEALSFDAIPINKTKRTRTMARQIYAFAVAHEMGWDGPAQELIDHGIRFITANGRTERGGWVKTFNPDGSVLDPTEDAYDQSCVLLGIGPLAQGRTQGGAGAWNGNLCIHRRISGGRAADRFPGNTRRHGLAPLKSAYASAGGVPCLV